MRNLYELKPVYKNEKNIVEDVIIIDYNGGRRIELNDWVTPLIDIMDGEIDVLCDEWNDKRNMYVAEFLKQFYEVSCDEGTVEKIKSGEIKTIEELRK